MADAKFGTNNGSSSTLDDKTVVEQESHTSGSRNVMAYGKDADRRRRELNLRIANPLSGYNAQQLGDLGEQYCRENSLGDEEDIRAFRLGAQVAQDPLKHAQVEGLTDEERRIFQDEVDHKWRQPKLLYLVIVLCSTCAAVQGMGMSSAIISLVLGLIRQ